MGGRSRGKAQDFHDARRAAVRKGSRESMLKRAIEGALELQDYTFMMDIVAGPTTWNVLRSTSSDLQ